MVAGVMVGVDLPRSGDELVDGSFGVRPAQLRVTSGDLGAVGTAMQAVAVVVVGQTGC
jgi:hypothetical protein